jgi:sulfatase modifying factor 1
MIGTQPHVLIYYATHDPEWPSDQIEVVALAIQQAGIRVSLDLWHQRDAGRNLDYTEWRYWSAESFYSATHLLFLVSTRFHEVWSRKRKNLSGIGIAFDTYRLISAVSHQLRRGNFKPVMTLRLEGSGSDCIPSDFAIDCPAYRWAVDSEEFLSHLAHASVASSTKLSDGLIPDVQHDPNRTVVDDPALSARAFGEPVTASGAILGAGSTFGIGESSIVLEGLGISTPGVTLPATEVEPEKTEAAQHKRVIQPSFAKSGLWPAEDEWRAPIGDFPPPWASAWGDDPYGLWADLTVNGATQRMRWIEPSGLEGFLMGSSKEERDAIAQERIRAWAHLHEHSPIRESVMEGFWLANTPCTQNFWMAIVGDNPSYFLNGPDARERPVESISWDLLMDEFIYFFSKKHELLLGGRMCLPTEIEWEYAARAGASTAYWWGDHTSNVEANWNQKNQGTTPVALGLPNPWGLFDVHGNVWEWCADTWRDRRDEQGAAIDRRSRVSRGGSWVNPPGRARSSHRGKWDRELAHQNQGFRFAIRRK